MGKVPKIGVSVRRFGEPASTNDAVRQLLETPSSVLEDTKRWPTIEDLGSGEVEVFMSFACWLDSRARELGGRYADALNWRPEWGPPTTSEAKALRWLKYFSRFVLPVGRECPEFHPGYAALKRQAQQSNRPVPERARAPEERPMIVSARKLVPFPDSSRAALILSERWDETRVTLFFLAERQEGRTIVAGEWFPVDAWFPTGDVRRWIHGDPENEGLVRLTEQARRWWSTLAGKPLDGKPGRTPGSGTWTFEHVLEQLLKYRQEFGPAPPPRDTFLERIGMNIRTWERKCKEWGYPWDQFAFLVYGPTGESQPSSDINSKQ